MDYKIPINRGWVNGTLPTATTMAQLRAEISAQPTDPVLARHQQDVATHNALVEGFARPDLAYRATATITTKRGHASASNFDLGSGQTWLCSPNIDEPQKHEAAGSLFATAATAKRFLTFDEAIQAVGQGAAAPLISVILCFSCDPAQVEANELALLCSNLVALSTGCRVYAGYQVELRDPKFRASVTKISRHAQRAQTSNHLGNIYAELSQAVVELTIWTSATLVTDELDQLTQALLVSFDAIAAKSLSIQGFDHLGRCIRTFISEACNRIAARAPAGQVPPIVDRLLKHVANYPQ